MNELSIDIDQALTESVRKHQLAVNQLTEEQFVKVLRQAIASGDFIQLVRQRDGGQSVIYIPFAMAEELHARIKSLQDINEKYKGVLIQIRDHHAGYGLEVSELAAEALREDEAL